MQSYSSPNEVNRSRKTIRGSLSRSFSRALTTLVCAGIAGTVAPLEAQATRAGESPEAAIEHSVTLITNASGTQRVYLATHDRGLNISYILCSGDLRPEQSGSTCQPLTQRLDVNQREQFAQFEALISNRMINNLQLDLTETNLYYLPSGVALAAGGLGFYLFVFDTHAYLGGKTYVRDARSIMSPERLREFEAGRASVRRFTTRLIGAGAIWGALVYAYQQSQSREYLRAMDEGGRQLLSGQLKREMPQLTDAQAVEFGDRLFNMYIEAIRYSRGAFGA